MRRLVLYSLAAAGPIACAAAAQGNSRILAHTVERGEWAVGSVADLRFGRVALVASPEGPRLEVRRLRPEIPTAPRVQIEGVTPPLTGNSLIVADFSQSNRTVLGGYFSPFMRLPSTAGGHSHSPAISMNRGSAGSGSSCTTSKRRATRGAT
jgi:hypothetical protein